MTHEADHAHIEQLLERVFAGRCEVPRVESVHRVDDDRGVFSTVERVHFASPLQIDGTSLDSVAVKTTRSDANGEAAVRSGAVAREVWSYESLLATAPAISSPTWFGYEERTDGATAAVMQDLSRHRFVDQMVGLEHHDVVAVARECAQLHLHHPFASNLDELDLRRNTPALLPAAGLDRGRGAVEALEIDQDARGAILQLADRREVVVAHFEAATAETGAATICHGDPRADNVAFDGEGRAVLFDWQQVAVQFGEADLAWLLATSTTPEVRRAVEADVVAGYALARGQSAATTWHRYRLGMVLPGLAVLLLAQRAQVNPSVEAFVTTSVQRIAAAVLDLGVADLP